MGSPDGIDADGGDRDPPRSCERHPAGSDAGATDTTPVTRWADPGSERARTLFRPAPRPWARDGLRRGPREEAMDRRALSRGAAAGIGAGEDGGRGRRVGPR